MISSSYEVHFAPLQGYTDWIYRNAFDRCFKGVSAYYTPFVRVERGGFRNRDRRDIDPANNTVPCLIPQILPGSPEEFRMLAELVKGYGYRRVDINMGCPFPMIIGKRKGAGILPFPDQVKSVLDTISEFPELQFSLKMRLGWENTGEGLLLMDIINSSPLTHVTVHTRTGKQQYKGKTDPDAFEAFYKECKHPLFYNGDLCTPTDIEEILSRFDRLRGVVVGRGLLSSPFLANDSYGIEQLTDTERMKRLKEFHDALYAGYAGHLQGDIQLLTKMKTVWDYLLPEADRKCLKKIQKANKLNDYSEAVKKIMS